MDEDDTVCSFDCEADPSFDQTSGLLVTGSKEYPIEPGRVFSIGRHSSSDISLPFRSISRHHASIEIVNGIHFLTDRNGKFGTYRANRRLIPCHEYELSHDVTLKFGPECIATYKIVPGSSFAKPQQSARKVNREVSNSVDINSPPREFVMQERTMEPTPVEHLFLEPSQSDVGNSSIASLKNRSGIRSSINPPTKSQIQPDKSLESDFSPKLVIDTQPQKPDNDDDDDLMVSAVNDDLDGTEDTVDEEMDLSDENLMAKVGEEVERQADAFDDNACGQKSAEPTRRSAEPTAKLFSQPPHGLPEAASIHSSVHWQSAEIAKETVGLATEESTKSTSIREIDDQSLPPIDGDKPGEDDEIPVKQKLTKGKRPTSRKKIFDDDDEIPTNSTEKPGKKGKKLSKNVEEKQKTGRKSTPPAQLASPPTVAAASALMDLKKTAEKKKENSPNVAKKGNSRKSVRRDAENIGKKVDDTLTGATDEDSKPTEKAKRAKKEPGNNVEPSEAKPSSSKTGVVSGVGKTDVEIRTPSRTSQRNVARRSALSARDSKILVTGEKNASTAEMIQQLGANYLSDGVTDCTHLVVDGIAKRTVKFVSCVGRGVPVASVEWLKASVAAKCLLEPDDFPPHGLEAIEEAQNFQLIRTMEQARKKRLLEGFTVYAIPKLTKLSETEIKAMVKSAGGRFQTRPPKSFAENTIVIVGDGVVPVGSDQQPQAAVSAPPDVGEFVAVGIPLVSTEFLLAGILRYDNDPAHFPVEIPISYKGAENVPDAATAAKGATKLATKSRRTTVAVGENGQGEGEVAAEKPKKTAPRKTMKQKGEVTNKD